MGKRIRWIDAGAKHAAELTDGDRSGANQPSQPREIDFKPPKPRELGTAIQAARRSDLSRHPLLTKALHEEANSAARYGNCLAHPNFGHRDIVGANIEELQISLAYNSMMRAYCPQRALQHEEGGEFSLQAGCALRTSTGLLFAGSSIGTRAGTGALSPLEVALTSLAANGVPMDVVTLPFG